MYNDTPCAVVVEYRAPADTVARYVRDVWAWSRCTRRRSNVVCAARAHTHHTHSWSALYARASLSSDHILVMCTLRVSYCGRNVLYAYRVFDIVLFVLDLFFCIDFLSDTYDELIFMEINMHVATAFIRTSHGVCVNKTNKWTACSIFGLLSCEWDMGRRLCVRF